jgi:hypothetical protein
MTDAIINYAARTDFRQRYYANDHSRDTVVIDAQRMAMTNGREVATDLDVEGFKLVPHVSVVGDFADRQAVADIHNREIAELLLVQTGADAVFCTSPGILRFGERSALAGKLNNSMPARFAHIDISKETAAGFAAAGTPEGKTIVRYAHYNVWRAFSPPPQDVPLAVCDAQSVSAGDLIEADAIFDDPEKPEWSFASYIVAHNPAHRWVWYPDMTRDEALIFKTSDSRFANPIPHVAFDNADVPSGIVPRSSIEMRAIAYWYA